MCNNTVMSIIKKTALGVCVSLLTAFLFIFGLTSGLYSTFGSPEPMKTALKDSGIYQSVVGDALEEVQKDQSEKGQKEELPLDNPDVQNIIKSAATPELLQAQTENALDSAYAWLKGDTEKLKFTVELGETKDRLADGVAQYAEQRMASLPACKSNVSRDVDPFTAKCLPRGVSPRDVAAEAKSQILSGEFLKEETLTADNLKGANGQTLEEQLKTVPVAYQAVKWAVYSAGLLAVLLAVAVVFLSHTWRSGLKKVALMFIFVGVVSVGVSLLANFGLGWVADQAKQPLQKSGVKVAELLVGDLTNWWMIYGAILFVLGVGATVALRFTRPKTIPGVDDIEEPMPESPDAPGTPEKPASPSEPKADPRQKPKPAKKLVQ